jgi:hypothetical protein
LYIYALLDIIIELYFPIKKINHQSNNSIFKTQK